VSHPNPIRNAIQLCYVTDRKALSKSFDVARPLLLERIETAGRAGIDWIQIREKDLPGRELAALAQEALRCVPDSCRVLINDRLDMAIAAGAGGVHLAERSIPVAEAKKCVRERGLPAQFLVGVSTHSLEAARAAAGEGADYVIFGPVFATPSKAADGHPQGIERLAEVCRCISIPVLAIGGITPENARSCVASGAQGIAGIRIFQDAVDLPLVVRNLRAM
jgi:thiamine-phosphate pyrophosphorylase